MIQGAIRVSYKYLPAYEFPHCIYYDCTQSTVHTAKEENIMANRNTKKSLERFKYEVADELGVPLSDGYNGNLTAKQNGSVGGYMVKKMIEAQEKQMAGRSADMQ